MTASPVLLPERISSTNDRIGAQRPIPFDATECPLRIDPYGMGRARRMSSPIRPAASRAAAYAVCGPHQRFAVHPSDGDGSYLVLVLDKAETALVGIDKTAP